MRTGFENRRNVIILAVLAAVLIVAIVYFVKEMFVGSPSPAPQTHATAEENPASQTAESGAGGKEAPKLPTLEKLDPTLHPEVMAGAESLEYSGAGRNIFSMTSAPVNIPKPVNNGRNETAKAAPPQPTGPPPPPPIDLKFFGYEAASGAKKAFLLHGDDVFIATEGEVVDHHYRVVKISPLSIQVTDLLYNDTQTLPLTQS